MKWILLFLLIPCWCSAQVYTSYVFTVVEQMPRFYVESCENMDATAAEKSKCAKKKMLEFIYKNIKMPDITREHGYECGFLVMAIVVNQQGNVESIELLRGEECYKDAAILTKIKERQWIPGKQNGVPVKVKIHLPMRICFR